MHESLLQGDVAVPCVYVLHFCVSHSDGCSLLRGHGRSHVALQADKAEVPSKDGLLAGLAMKRARFSLTAEYLLAVIPLNGTFQGLIKAGQVWLHLRDLLVVRARGIVTGSSDDSAALMIHLERLLSPRGDVLHTLVVIEWHRSWLTRASRNGRCRASRSTSICPIIVLGDSLQLLIEIGITLDKNCRVARFESLLFCLCGRRKSLCVACLSVAFPGQQ